MPGYIHTCDQCGSHMQVHERYLGRTLKCTTCRKEFLAMLPADAEVVDPPPVEIELPAPRRKWARHLRWLAAVVPLVLLVWWLGQDQTGKFGSRILAPNRSTGEIGVLQSDAGDAVVVALDPEAAKVLVNLGDAVEGEDFQVLVEQGRVVEVAGGTKVRVLESGARGRVLRVRIISGPWESRKVWVPSRRVR